MALKPDRHLHLIYDDVLIRSIVEYREAIAMLETTDRSPETSDHVDAMRQELARLEDELERRGIDPASIPSDYRC